MAAAYHRLLAALDELHAAIRDYRTCLPVAADQDAAIAAATRRVVQADAAWLDSGEQITAEERAALETGLGDIVRLARA
jgi:hypothetical protein